MSIVIARPGKKSSSANGNPYIRVNIGGESKMVMLDAETIKDWDNIKEMTVDLVKYTKRTASQEDVTAGKADAVGNLFDEEWFRAEVTDYQTFGREVSIKEHSVRLMAIERKMLKETVVDSDEVAKLMAEAV